MDPLQLIVGAFILHPLEALKLTERAAAAGEHVCNMDTDGSRRAECGLNLNGDLQLTSIHD